MAVEPVIKTYEMKPERPPRRKNRVKIIFWQFIILLVLSVILAVAAKYYWLPKYFPHKTQTVITTTEISKSEGTLPAAAPASAPVAPSTVAAEVPKPEADKKVDGQIEKLEEKLNKISEEHKNLLSYLAARDLNESLGNTDNFKTQLEFFSEIATDDANLNGRIDILRQATANGLVTRDKLLVDLKVLEHTQMLSANDSFSGSVGGALSNLVRVSKIEGDISATDYNSILKRAELALGKEKLSAAELQNTLNEIAKIGKPAENFVKEASNLARVMEVTEFLATYTKAKAIKAESVND